MRKPLAIVLLLLGAGLLLCLLAYPFGYDQAVFAVAGELSVKHGAVTYRDFLDTKPPLIFTIYGVAIWLFGHHEWAPRLFDAIVQALTLVYFYRVLLRSTKDTTVAFGSVLLYIVLYVTSGFWMTGQAETFALLPIVWILSLSEQARNGTRALSKGILVGCASAILFLLKFTLLVVPAGAVLYLVLYSDDGTYRNSIRFAFGAIASLTISLGVVIGYMSWAGALRPFFETLAWLGGYAGIDPVLGAHTIGELYFRQFPLAVVTALLPTTLVLAFVGIFRNRRSEARPATIYSHLLIQLGFGLFSVLYERKFFPYHFSRVYFAFVPFVVLGTRSAWALTAEYLSSIRNLRGIQRSLRQTAVLGITAIAVFYSPLVRIVTNPLYWAQLRLKGGDAGAAADSKFGGLYYADQERAASELKSALRPNETIFLWGNNVGLYFRTEVEPRTICLTNTPLVTSWTPQTWKDTLLRQLQSAPPRFFVCETNDARPYITGDTLDSRQHLEQWSELASFVHTNYHDWKTVGHFVIYEHQ